MIIATDTIHPQANGLDWNIKERTVTDFVAVRWFWDKNAQLENTSQFNKIQWVDQSRKLCTV